MYATIEVEMGVTPFSEWPGKRTRQQSHGNRQAGFGRTRVTRAESEQLSLETDATVWLFVQRRCSYQFSQARFWNVTGLAEEGSIW
jgi:hypothetical protein